MLLYGQQRPYSMAHYNSKTTANQPKRLQLVDRHQIGRLSNTHQFNACSSRPVQPTRFSQRRKNGTELVSQILLSGL